jgi:hypothetical protein
MMQRVKINKDKEKAKEFYWIMYLNVHNDLILEKCQSSLRLLSLM